MRIFSTEGKTLKEREGKLPDVLGVPTDGAGYVATDALADAVDAAILTGLPLLITGEPGCGKTRLANAIAYQLDLPLLSFNTKSTATARELLYQYDVVGRFYDAENAKLGLTANRDPSRPENYVTFGALGAAILLASLEKTAVTERYPRALDGFPGAAGGVSPVRSVVLIDEVDKAPRDFPNDLLNELDRLQFQVVETNRIIAAAPTLRPIVLLTSNNERELPEPFLRRCAFFHISGEADLERIVKMRLGATTELTEPALEHYRALRKQGGWEKTPSIGELLIWLRLLAIRGVKPEDFKPVNQEVRDTYVVLFKTDADRKRAGA